MRLFGIFVRVIVLVALFAGVGIWVSHAIEARAMAQGKAEYEVRLASYMSGLFAGGVVVTLAGISMLLVERNLARRREPPATDPSDLRAP